MPFTINFDHDGGCRDVSALDLDIEDTEMKHAHNWFGLVWLFMLRAPDQFVKG